MNKKIKISLLLFFNILIFSFANAKTMQAQVESAKYAGEKNFYSACVKLNNEKIDKLISKIKQAYRRTIKSDGKTGEERCKSITKDINVWGVELNASDYRMNGFYDFLVEQMKEQL